MKRKIKRKDLVNNDDIWNVVISVICESDFPTENKIKKEAFTVFQYYSELESGGHESLLTWFSEYIKEVGIDNYLKELIEILEKIGAVQYAAIEKKYIEEMWRLFVALENKGIKEDEFYHAVEKGNNEYDSLNGALGKLLEAYFINIYTDLIEVVED